jgi:hypothetical protein
MRRMSLGVASNRERIHTSYIVRVDLNPETISKVVIQVEAGGAST